MNSTLTANQPAIAATTPQIQYITDLMKSRNYSGNISPKVLSTVICVKYNSELPVGADTLPISKTDASDAIKALLQCSSIASKSVGLTSVAQLLVKIPQSMYALPRKNDPNTWDFFEVVTRRNGRIYINQLIGSPGDWNRKFLPPALQAAAARAILLDPKAAAVAYAKQHGRCAVCNAHLSDPASIDRSMGPVCAKRFI